ncbi:ABC transporter permease subunit [Streptomyces malaysiense]|uniref:ABC transporter permease subunit n=1 Tax=Streptomyces malaysiense TaxID=1428626 RepID=UPI001160BE22|nr:ABC transporter permease subunit [Streptomyces malaysiense]
MRYVYLAELRKIAFRPLSLLLLLVLGLGVLYTAWVAQDWSSGQTLLFKNALVAAEHRQECAGLKGAELRKCLTHPSYVPMAESDLRQQLANDRAVAPTQTVPGAFGWSAQTYASLPGFAIALLLGTALVAGEWERRTATSLLIAQPDLRRVLLAKAMALWTVLAAHMIVCGLVVALANVTYFQSHDKLYVPTPHGLALAEWVARQGGVGLVAMAVASVVVTLIAARSRTRALTFIAGGLLVLLANMGASVKPVWAWLPGGILADAMDFQTVFPLWNHWWGAASGSGMPLWLRAVPTVALLAMAGLWLMRRVDSRDRVA